MNLPAHFVVRPVAEGVEALVDVYNAGAIIAVEDAEELLGPLYGQGAKIQIDRSFFDDDAPKPRSILTRMLVRAALWISRPSCSWLTCALSILHLAD